LKSLLSLALILSGGVLAGRAAGNNTNFKRAGKEERGLVSFVDEIINLHSVLPVPAAAVLHWLCQPAASA
jgi:hypothetical protein